MQLIFKFAAYITAIIIAIPLAMIMVPFAFFKALQSLLSDEEDYIESWAMLASYDSTMPSATVAFAEDGNMLLTFAIDPFNEDAKWHLVGRDE